MILSIKPSSHLRCSVTGFTFMGLCIKHFCAQLKLIYLILLNITLRHTPGLCIVLMSK